MVQWCKRQVETSYSVSGNISPGVPDSSLGGENISRTHFHCSTVQANIAVELISTTPCQTLLNVQLSVY
jgi:hypothetical protein